MLNRIICMGRLTRDPELRYTASNVPVCSFTVAVERDFEVNGERPTDFIDAVAWRQAGEFVSKHFHQGSMIVVEGRMESRKWQDRDGNKRISWEINVDRTYFGGSKKNSDGSGSAQSSGYQAPQPSAPTSGTYPAPAKFTEIDPDEDDGELPFD